MTTQTPTSTSSEISRVIYVQSPDEECNTTSKNINKELEDDIVQIEETTTTVGVSQVDHNDEEHNAANCPKEKGMDTGIRDSTEIIARDQLADTVEAGDATSVRPTTRDNHNKADHATTTSLENSIGDMDNSSQSMMVTMDLSEIDDPSVGTVDAGDTASDRIRPSGNPKGRTTTISIGNTDTFQCMTPTDSTEMHRGWSRHTRANESVTSEISKETNSATVELRTVAHPDLEKEEDLACQCKNEDFNKADLGEDQPMIGEVNKADESVLYSSRDAPDELTVSGGKYNGGMVALLRSSTDAVAGKHIPTEPSNSNNNTKLELKQGVQQENVNSFTSGDGCTADSEDKLQNRLSANEGTPTFNAFRMEESNVKFGDRYSVNTSANNPTTNSFRDENVDVRVGDGTSVDKVTDKAATAAMPDRTQNLVQQVHPVAPAHGATQSETASSPNPSLEYVPAQLAASKFCNTVTVFDLEPLTEFGSILDLIFLSV